MPSKVSPISRLQATDPAPKPLTNKVSKDAAVDLFVNMMYGAGVDVDKRVVKKQNKKELLSVLNMASLISRQSLQSALGQSFNGKRDLYDVVGWKKELVFTDYLNMYERNGFASRVVNIKADETWRKFPILHDGKDKKDYKDATSFLSEWATLVENLDLASVFHNLDVALGISRFALIVIGVKGDTDYSKPLETGTAKTVEFLRVLDEGMVTMSMPIRDTLNPRYGFPEMYYCQFDEDAQAIPIHWTRVVHFKQGYSRSVLYGVPGLMKSFNYLQDIDKVIASSSEAFWQHIRRAIALIAKEGFTLPEKGTPGYEALEEQVENWRHQMDLVLKLRNMDVQDLSSSAVDGAGQHGLLVTSIAGTEGIPERILVGSERGELASSQDVLNLNNSIAARQQKTCAPWVRAFVKYLYQYKFIAPPETGKFSIEWQSLFDPSPTEKLAIAKDEAVLINEITGGNFQEFMSYDDFSDRHLDGYRLSAEGKAQAEAAAEIADEEPPDDGGGESVGAAGLIDESPNDQRI